MKIYVASSWRNEQQPQVVHALRRFGHVVYDFKAEEGFHWRDLDPDWQSWTSQEFQEALNHPRAEAGFILDFKAMENADACVLVMPCGRSAHLEAGWFIGAGKPCIILLAEEGNEPELMYSMATICNSIGEVGIALKAAELKGPNR